MTRVRWTDNICTVGGTCIHGYFTKIDLARLFELCPDATFTPTFFHEKLGPYGYSVRDIDRLDQPYSPTYSVESIGTKEQGYYFTFMEKDGEKLFDFLRQQGYQLKRGESIYG